LDQGRHVKTLHGSSVPDRHGASSPRSFGTPDPAQRPGRTPPQCPRPKHPGLQVPLWSPICHNRIRNPSPGGPQGDGPHRASPAKRKPPRFVKRANPSVAHVVGCRLTPAQERRDGCPGGSQMKIAIGRTCTAGADTMGSVDSI
jgi:hypothetical protein